MKKDKSSTEFRSSDFYLSAYLITAGMKLIQTENLKPKKVVFVFQDTFKRIKLVNSFYCDQASVNPLEYKNRLNDLKSLLHNLK